MIPNFGTQGYRFLNAAEGGANGNAAGGGSPSAGQASGAGGPDPADTSGPDPKLPVFDKVAVMGDALWLMQHSAAHKHLFITDIDWMLVPPVALEQYRLWKRDNLPVAFATWGYLSPDAESRLLTGVRNVTESDWNSGEQLWLMDLIAPFGGQEEAALELKEKIFQDRSVKTISPGPDGSVAVVEW